MRHTAHVRATAEPAVAASLAEVFLVVQTVGDFADRRATARVDLANFAGLQLDERVVARLLVRDDLSESTRGADELGAAVRAQAEVVDKRARRDETQGHDVAGLDGDLAQEGDGERLRGGGGDLGLQLDGLFGRLPAVELVDVARHEVLRDACAEAGDDVAGAKAVGRDDVGIRLDRVRVARLDEGNVGSATRVVFYANDVLEATLLAHEVDVAQTAPVPAADEAHRYTPVPAAAALLALGYGETAQRSAGVEMGIYGPLEMAEGVVDGLVASEEPGVGGLLGRDGLRLCRRGASKRRQGRGRRDGRRQVRGRAQAGGARAQKERHATSRKTSPLRCFQHPTTMASPSTHRAALF